MAIDAGWLEGERPSGGRQGIAALLGELVDRAIGWFEAVAAADRRDFEVQ
jgi:hypothetical protein